MYKIYQKKYWLCKRSVEIDTEKEVIRTRITMNFNTNGCEVPFSEIDPEERTTKRPAFNLYIYSLIASAAGFLILPFAAMFFYIYIFSLFGGLSTSLEWIAAITGGILASSPIFFLALYLYKHAKISSCEIAIFNKKSNGTACIVLFNTAEFAEDYQIFKETLMKEINKSMQKNFFIEVIKKAETEFLVNNFRHELIKELQTRGVNIKELSNFIAETYSINNKGNVVPFERL